MRSGCEPWSAASLARPTAIGTVGRTFRQLPANRESGSGDSGVVGAAYHDAHSFLSASDVVTHMKRGVATPVGLASEAALHGLYHHVVPTGHYL
jgi:hypothetical protein